ncbi:hypothetical protein [Niabella ginsengisoli]|uniref:Uncharacterized protein n=1 Tax=Niabella ginsengisoli TaxID=522298 RepID=A0ABS9SLR8_9BACT|nr:hypothetical protein [Niabella ginsengisoli]MCH5599226.1 hypothetical protein [Niabella ginsengisoli]
MQKHKFSELFADRIVLNNIEVIPNHVYFTGDAIALWNNREDGNEMELDEWDWHEDIRSGNKSYIVTDIKKNNPLSIKKVCRINIKVLTNNRYFLKS